jgi:hypothetical protein
MPDFGNTLFEGSILPEVQRQEPVQDNSGAVLAEGLRGAFNTVGSIFGSMAGQAKAGQTNSILNAYRQDLLKLANAAEQGMGLQEMRMRSRALLSQYISNNPDVDGEEFQKINTNFLGNQGFANILTTGNEDVQRQQKIIDSAVAAGFINPYDTPDKQARDADVYLQHQSNVSSLQRQVDILQRSNTIVTEQDKARTTQLVKNYAETGYVWAENNINKAIAMARSDPANAAKYLEDLKATVGGELSRFTVTAEGSDVGWITKPIEDRLKLAEEMILGKTETSVYESQVANIKARESAAMLADPEIAKLIVASDLLGAASPTVLSQMTSKAIDLYITNSKSYNPDDPNSNKSADTVGTEKDVVKSLEVLRNDINSSLTGEITPTRSQEIKNSIINNMRAIKEHSGGARGPQDYNALVNFFADSGVGEAAKGLEVPGDLRDQALNILETQYNDVLLPLVREQLDANPSISIYPSETALPPHLQGTLAVSEGQTDVPTNTAIEIVFNGLGVEFRPTEAYKNDVTIRARAEALNRGPTSVAQPLNTLIRAQAHILGGNNYKAEWDSIATRLFPSGETSMNTVTQTNSPGSGATEGQLEGFLEGQGPATLETFGEDIDMPDEGSGEFIEPTSNPEVNPQVLERWRGKRLPVSIRNNNPAAISIVGSIEDSFAASQPGFVGVTKRPANEGGHYAKYATPEDGLRAASTLLRSYGRKGINTPSAIVKRWSTDKAAHNSYANTLVKYLKQVGYDVTNTSKLNLEDPVVRRAILKAKSAHESGAGVPVYADEVYERVT